MSTFFALVKMYSRGWDALEYIFLPVKNVLKGVGRPCVHFFALVKMYSREWDALAYIFLPLYSCVSRVFFLGTRSRAMLFQFRCSGHR